MAADGWFYQWFADGWFPPVWFAPADESAVPPEELRPSGGGQVVPRKTRKPNKGPNRPAWVIPPQFVKPRPWQHETEAESEALLLCGIL